MIFTNYFCGVQNSLVLKINQEILFSEWGKSKMRKDGTILHGGKNGNKSFFLSFFAKNIVLIRNVVPLNKICKPKVPTEF
jgi:hypothetical protein